MVNKVPENIQAEMEKINEIIQPVMKIRSRYLLFSIPIIAISFINFFTLLFLTTINQDTTMMLMVYGFFAAIGLALYKEGKHKTEQIKQMSSDYMIERVKKSPFVSEYLKEEYVKLIKEQPILAMNNFIQFLNEEENQMKQRRENFKKD